MPNVIPFPQPQSPEPARDAGHDWILPHMAVLLRYCALNGLAAEEAVIARAIEGLVGLRQDRRADGTDGA